MHPDGEKDMTVLVWVPEEVHALKLEYVKLLQTDGVGGTYVHD